MTFVGHSLVGAALAQATVPRKASWKLWLLVVNGYVMAAFFPDLPLPGWGHTRYFFSHSLFVNLVLIALLSGAACYYRSRVRWLTCPLVAGAAAAWLSHFPLDALYNHGRGVAIFWPFSEAALNLPLPWFTTLDMRQPLTAARNVHVFLVEAAVYVPLFMAALGGRRLWQRGRRSGGQGE